MYIAFIDLMIEGHVYIFLKDENQSVSDQHSSALNWMRTAALS